MPRNWLKDRSTGTIPVEPRPSAKTTPLPIGNTWDLGRSVGTLDQTIVQLAPFARLYRGSDRATGGQRREVYGSCTRG